MVENVVRRIVGTPTRPWRVLALQAGFVFIIAVAGGLVSRMNLDWYHGLNRPWFIPPDWAFGPAWTVMFILMTIAAWLTWRRLRWPAARMPMIFWIAQLVLNLLWSTLFFGFHLIAVSFFESLLLVAAVWLTNLSFFAAGRLPGWLMLPVSVWVLFASFLSVGMWWANAAYVP